MAETPFTPYTDTLQDVLRNKYLKPVAKWLLGKTDDIEVLAQKTRSSWESALTLIFLSSFEDILSEKNDDPQLQELIKRKNSNVAKWLLTRKCHDKKNNIDYFCWEKVTWDTAVVVRSLLIALKKYPDRFSNQQEAEVIDAIKSGTVWLYHRFFEWETEVKYPFGPADIAQILITLVYLQEYYPKLHTEIFREYFPRRKYVGYFIKSDSEKDLSVEVVKYLLHIQTEKSITVVTGAGQKEDIITSWWDDYFTTAEVIEALANFYFYCEKNPRLKIKYKDLLAAVRTSITDACTYFEQNQIDGTWGSHIDTIKVINAYVMIRKLEPQDNQRKGNNELLIIPEIHTTFKALRWICDDKQIFGDGENSSFMHTMFLTIFYSLALIEVHNSWQTAKNTIEKIYDDVVWSSPMRTTPERSKRLKLSLENQELIDKVDDLLENKETRKKISRTFIIIILTVFLYLTIGYSLGIFNITLPKIGWGNYDSQKTYIFTFSAIFVAIATANLVYTWNKNLKPSFRDKMKKRKII